MCLEKGSLACHQVFIEHVSHGQLGELIFPEQLTHACHYGTDGAHGLPGTPHVCITTPLRGGKAKMVESPLALDGGR